MLNCDAGSFFVVATCFWRMFLMNIIKEAISKIIDYIEGQPLKAGSDASESAKQKRMSLFPPPPCKAQGIEGTKGISSVKNAAFLCFTIICPPFLLGYFTTAAFINAIRKDPTPQESQTNSYKYRQNLQELYANRDAEPDFLIKLGRKIFPTSIDDRRKSDDYMHSEEHNRIILIQDNLVTSDNGTYDKPQVKLFKSHTANNPSPSVVKLHQALENFTTFDTLDLASSSSRDSLADTLEKQSLELKPGESMWVDMTTLGMHSMKGRIEKTDDGKYVFQMSNTGAGVSKHSNWHKSETFMSSNFYQTVVQWGPFETSNIFSKEFFRDIMNACLDGKAPDGVEIENTDELGENGEALQAIDTVYKTLGHHLPEPNDLPLRENLSHWSTLQEGGSCVPNSIWALIRVSLPESEYQGLRTEIQLNNLQHLYQSIISGKDATDYTLLLALEQVKTLIINAETAGKGKAAPEIYKNIQKDLQSRVSARQLADDDLKINIINPNPVIISDATMEVELKAGRLVRRPGELNADVVYESISDMYPLSNRPQDGKIKEPSLKIERDDQGEPTGVATLAFLLYEAILNDESIEIEAKLKKFVGFLNGIEDPAEIKADKEELLALTKMFNTLSVDSRNIDGTSQSRPKQLALINISQALYTLLYAQCVKTNQNPYDQKSAINVAGVDMFENVDELKRAALTFSKLASKVQQGVYGSNIWYEEDRGIRVFHNKNKWNAYNERLIYDASIEEKRQMQINAGVGRLQIPYSSLNEKSKLNLGVPPLEENNALKSLVFFQPLDKNTRKPLDAGKIDVGFALVYDKALPEVEIEFIDDKPVATTLAGNAYLLYRLLPNANDSVDNLDQLSEIMDKINLLEVQPSEIASLKAVAGYLRNYSERMRLLDRSPESVALQLLAVKLGFVLLNKVEATQVELSPFRLEIDYNEALNPKAYLSFKNSDPEKRKGDKLISLIDHPIFK